MRPRIAGCALSLEHAHRPQAPIVRNDAGRERRASGFRVRLSRGCVRSASEARVPCGVGDRLPSPASPDARRVMRRESQTATITDCGPVAVPAGRLRRYGPTTRSFPHQIAGVPSCRGMRRSHRRQRPLRPPCSVPRGSARCCPTPTSPPPASTGEPRSNGTCHSRALGTLLRLALRALTLLPHRGPAHSALACALAPCCPPPWSRSSPRRRRPQRPSASPSAAQLTSPPTPAPHPGVPAFTRSHAGRRRPLAGTRPHQDS